MSRQRMKIMRAVLQTLDRMIEHIRHEDDIGWVTFHFNWLLESLEDEGLLEFEDIFFAQGLLAQRVLVALSFFKSDGMGEWSGDED